MLKGRSLYPFSFPSFFEEPNLELFQEREVYIMYLCIGDVSPCCLGWLFSLITNALGHNVVFQKRVRHPCCFEQLNSLESVEITKYKESLDKINKLKSCGLYFCCSHLWSVESHEDGYMLSSFLIRLQSNAIA